MRDAIGPSRATRWIVACVLGLLVGLAVAYLPGLRQPPPVEVAATEALSGLRPPPAVGVAATEPLPALTGRVVDNAGLLPPDREAALTERLRAHEARTGNQLVVVTLPSLAGESIEAVALRLGNGWGIGRKDIDDGVLLIVAPNEKRVRIEVGRGLTGRIPDERAAAMIDQMLPAFKQNRFADGIDTGVDAIIAALS